MKKRLIILLVLVCAIPVIVSSLFSYYLFQQKVLADFEAIGMGNAKTVELNVEELINKRLALLHLLARSHDIRNFDSAYGKQQLKEAFEIYPDMTLALDDMTGEQKLRGDELKTANVGSRQYFKDAQGGKDALSDVLFSKNDNRQIVVLASPVRSVPNGPVIGVVQGSLTLAEVDRFVENHSQKDATAYIIGSDGKILAHPDKEISGEHKDMSEMAFVKAGLQGTSGSAEYTDGQGQKKIVNYVHNSRTGWLICTESPYQVVMAQTSKLKLQTGTILLVTILLVALLGSFIAGRTVVKPITEIVNATTKVKEGDLQVQIAITDTNELGKLADNFNGMVANLRTLVQDVRLKAETVVSASEQMEAGAEQSAKANEQVVTAITQVTAGAEKQSEAVSATAAIVQQTVASIRHIDDSVLMVADVSAKTEAAAHAGGIAIGIAIEQMKNIEKTVAESAGGVGELGKRSQEIGEIAATIAGIAGQTNLLALNAAIEAARAGEQGRGFSVVAEEVRKLAEQSQAAAQNIAQLIGYIQTETAMAVTAMDAGNREVSEGAGAVNNAGNTFNEIVSHIDNLSGRVDDISAAIGQVSSGSQKILDAMQTIEAVSKQSVGQTQSVSAATEEQSASMQEIVSSGEALLKMAADLKKDVDKFKS